MGFIPPLPRAPRLGFSAAIDAALGHPRHLAAGAEAARPALGSHRRRSGASDDRRAVRRPRRAPPILLALLVLAASSVTPAIGGESLDQRFGVDARGERVERSRASILSDDLARAAGRSAWATHGGRGATSESLRAARRAGSPAPQRLATTGGSSTRAPRVREVARLGVAELGRSDGRIVSLAAAPRGPPLA